MANLPVIVSAGGVNAAGRSTYYSDLERMVYDSLSDPAKQALEVELESLTQSDSASALENSLIREIHPDWYNPLALNARRRHDDVWLEDERVSPVRSAGMLPTGFKPDSLYKSRAHPRALQLTVFAASEMLAASGLNWGDLKSQVAPDQIAVYAGNSIGQLDGMGFGGMLQAALHGKRVSSKQLPLGYPQMPADFVNAYILGTLGATGAVQGACASFLYNLFNASQAIQTGRARIAIVGGADAPIVPEVVEGFRAMSALADEAGLRALDNLAPEEAVNWRRASRPFGNNCGFTIGEASQFVMLMDDQLAAQVGARILGCVPGIFVNADGPKRSISAPGAGNYLTMAKAAGLARGMLGESRMRQLAIHAHGTSTPQNRVTESHVLSQVAKAMGAHWPVTAIKSYIGHSQGTAGGDQLANALGTFATGWLPGIKTTQTLAEDVHTEGLDFVLEDRQTTPEGFFLNAKGFGGNNATALVLGPQQTQRMMSKRHDMQAWATRHAAVDDAHQLYGEQSRKGQYRVEYHFGENVIDGEEVKIGADSLSVPGWTQGVDLQVHNPFEDMN